MDKSRRGEDELNCVTFGIGIFASSLQLTKRHLYVSSIDSGSLFNFPSSISDIFAYLSFIIVIIIHIQPPFSDTYHCHRIATTFIAHDFVILAFDGFIFLITSKFVRAEFF